MTRAERAAVRWAVKLLNEFFALTGMEPKPESRTNLEVLRAAVKGGA